MPFQDCNIQKINLISPLLIGVFLLIAFSCQSSAVSRHFRTNPLPDFSQERELTLAANDIKLDKVYYVSPDQNTIIYTAIKANGQSILFQNETILKEFDTIESFQVSQDSLSFFYRIKKDGKVFVGVNDSLSSAYEKIETWQTSEDGNHIAYLARQNDKWFVAKDQWISSAYEEIKELQFSQDGQSVFYLAKQDGKVFVIKNDTPLTSGFEDISSLAITPSGKSFVYAAKNDEKWFAALNKDLISAPYDKILALDLRKDGSSLAYLAQKEESFFLAFNGRLIKLDADSIENFAFSQNGKVFFHVAKKDGKFFVAFNAKRVGSAFDSVEAVQTSDDGKYIAYMAIQGERILLGHNSLLLHTPFNKVNFFQLTKDGEYFIYMGHNSRKHGLENKVMFCMYNKKFSREFDAIIPISFSEDKKNLTYISYYNKKFFVAYNEKLVDFPFDSIVYPLKINLGGSITYLKKQKGKLQIQRDKDRPTPLFDSISFVQADKNLHAVLYENSSEALEFFGKPQDSNFEKQLLSTGLSYSKSLQLGVDTLPLFYLAKKNETVSLGREEKIIGKPFDAILPIQFSQDKKTLLYLAKKNDEVRIGLNERVSTLVFDSIEGPVLYPPKVKKETQGENSFLALTKESMEDNALPIIARLIYKAKKDGKYFLGFDDKLSPPFDDVSKPFVMKNNRVGFLRRAQGKLFFQTFSVAF